MKTLVTGAAGQLGVEVVRILEASADGRDVTIVADHAELDIGDGTAVREVILRMRPDAVINCAARTAVDDCEADPASAFRVNADGVGHLAEACAAAGAHFTTISTDYVFDGTKLKPYAEGDAANPLSVYGRSKLAGEQAALAGGDGDSVTVVRTSLVCGAHGANAVKTVLEQLRHLPELRYVTDQVACPTFAADLAEAVVRLTRQRLGGLFHVTNEGAVSRFDLARATAAASGADPERVLPITTGRLRPQAAARPAYSALDNAALRDAGEPALRHFTEPLAELVAQLR